MKFSEELEYILFCSYVYRKRSLQTKENIPIYYLNYDKLKLQLYKINSQSERYENRGYEFLEDNIEIGKYHRFYLFLIGSL